MVEGLALLFGKSSLFEDQEMGLWISFFCWKKATFVPKMLRSNKAMANSHKSAVSPKQKIRQARQSVSLQYRLPIL